VYFVTQSPSDIPESVLGQLGNRVQHALRLLRRTIRRREGRRPDFAQRILHRYRTSDTELAVGEALVSLLDEKGSPGIVERAWMLPPSSQIGPIAESQRAEIRKSLASIYGHYDQTIDRESAYEKVKARTLAKETPAVLEQRLRVLPRSDRGFRDVV